MALIGSVVLGQTTSTPEVSDENDIFFSELTSPDSPDDKPAEVSYGPWGCHFTLRPLDLWCGAEEIVPPPPDILREQAEILDFLRGRKERLDAREKEMVEKAKELASLEQRIEQKINEVRLINDEIDQTYRQKAEQDAEALTQLVSYYEKMPPDNAALFFNTMDRQTAIMIITRMSARRAAAILAILEPEVAVELTESIAKITVNREQYSNLPQFSEDQ